MTECAYCATGDYTGDSLPLAKNIDGGKQGFDMYIFDSPENESHVLVVDGTYTELRVVINFCPICGRPL